MTSWLLVGKSGHFSRVLAGHWEDAELGAAWG